MRDVIDVGSTLGCTADPYYCRTVLQSAQVSFMALRLFVCSQLLISARAKAAAAAILERTAGTVLCAYQDNTPEWLARGSASPSSTYNTPFILIKPVEYRTFAALWNAKRLCFRIVLSGYLWSHSFRGVASVFLCKI